VAAPTVQPSSPNGALRRPLVGRDGRVAAFEWLLAGLNRRPEQEVLALLAAIGAAPRPGLLTLPQSWLDRPSVFSALPSGLWLLLDGPVDADLARALRARGLRLGEPDGLPTASRQIDFIVATASGGGLETLLLSAQRWREAQPRVQMVALGLTAAGDVEQLLAQGYHRAGGLLGRSSAPPAPRPLGAEAHRICDLLNRLSSDADTATLAEAVRGDVALGYRLLRYANSPSIGLVRPVESAEQAIAVLGRRELTRWLQVLLLSAAASRPAQRALHEHTLVRARLLEGLARRRGEPEPGAFFTLGMLSMLEMLLQLPLSTALAPLRLRAEIQQALLQRQGPWSLQLELLDALDDPDESRAWRAAAGLGQAECLTEEVAAAWAWAAGVDAGG